MVPVNKTVVLQVTAVDVIHSFVIQSFGIRIDAVPGRLNETWFKADREGVYYGQCSKICGKDHAFMPIAFRVVSDETIPGLARRCEEEVCRGAEARFRSPTRAATDDPSIVRRRDDETSRRTIL